MRQDASDNARVVFAGGGSGGHLVPGVEVATEVARQATAAEFLFLRGRRRVEGLVLERAPGKTDSLRGLEAPVGMLGRVRFAVKFPIVFARSVVALKRFGADTVVGLGGYGAVPPVLAARALGLRVVLLEQNVRPGKANRLLGPFAHHVCCAFRATAKRFRRGVATGNPVRRLAGLERTAALRRFGLSEVPGTTTVLVVGGSQGARGLNTLVTEHLDALSRFGGRVQILHVSGEADRDRVTDAYRQHGIPAHVVPFIPDMDVAYRAADFVVSRAGGTTLAELAVAGLPAVLVPYPHHRDRHQFENARIFAEAGAGFVLDERDADSVSFGRTVGALLEDLDLRRKMAGASRALAQPEAAAQIACFILGRRSRPFDDPTAEASAPSAGAAPVAATAPAEANRSPAAVERGEATFAPER